MLANRREWWKGRHARLRIWCRKAWGFKSPLPHHQAVDLIEKTRQPLPATVTRSLRLLALVACMSTCSPAAPRLDDTLPADLRLADTGPLRRFLDNEQTYSESVLSAQSKLTTAIVRELLVLEPSSSSEEIIRLGNTCYRSHQETGRTWPIIVRFACRTPHDLELAVDFNYILQQRPGFHPSGLRFGPKGDVSALTLSTQQPGQEILVTTSDGKTIENQAPHLGIHSFEWSNSGRLLYYTTMHNQRPYQLVRWDRVTKQARILYAEDDWRYFLTMRRSGPGMALFVESASLVSSRSLWVDLDCDDSPLRTANIARQNVTSKPFQWRSLLVNLITPLGGAPYLEACELASAPCREPQMLLQSPPDEPFIDLQPQRDFLVVKSRKEGAPRLSFLPWQSHTLHRISMPGGVFELKAAALPDYDSGSIAYSVSSFDRPKESWTYDVKLGVPAKSSAGSSIDAGLIPEVTVKRLWTDPAGGEPAVPISIAYPVAKDPPYPFVLYGYGAYGVSVDPAFETRWIPLLRRGAGVAICHARGGGEMGPAWHDAGRRENKENSFTDFLACAKTLISHNLTLPGRIAALGRSAGGLLVVVAASREPELFGALVMEHPYLDVMGTLLDPQLPATVREYDEWGDPKSPVERSVIEGYDPLLRVNHGRLPATLMTVAIHDSVLPLWQSLNWVLARRRSVTQDDNNPLLILSSESSSHWGETNSFDEAQRQAQILAFILSHIG